jgi:hypothetical protein
MPLDAEVIDQVAYQADAVGVVAERRAVAVETQRVDRPGACCPCGVRRGQAVGLLLEWHRDVEASAAGRGELVDRRGQRACRHAQRLVGQPFAGLRREASVYLR